jgi:hypothetical protein
MGDDIAVAGGAVGFEDFGFRGCGKQQQVLRLRRRMTTKSNSNSNAKILERT